MIRLREILTRKGISQEDFARLMNTSSSTVSRWCNGKMIPEEANLLRMAQVLMVHVEELSVELPVLSDLQRQILDEVMELSAAQQRSLLIVARTMAGKPADLPQDDQANKREP